MEKNEVKLKAGDVVQLLSGSPKMTVIEVHYNDDVECKYYNTSTFSFEKETINAIALIRVEQ